MRVFLVILSLIAAGLLGYYGGRYRTADTDSIEGQLSQSQATRTSAKQASLASAIHCQGKLAPASGLVQILAPVGSQISKLTEKKVGAVVVKGEVLATLQSRALRAKDLKLAKARRTDALNQASLEKEQGKLKLKSARLAVEEAEAADEKISSEQKKIQLLKRQHQTSQSMLTRLQQIKSDPTTQDLLNQTDLEKQELVVAQLSLQIEQAQLEVTLARKSAGRAKSVAENNAKSVASALANADGAVPIESLNVAVEMAEEAYDMTEIKSPINTATILDIIVREGDSVTNKPVMVIGDTSEMHCIAEVSDQFLHQIDLKKHGNLRAKITSAAILNPLMGTVVRKGVMIGAPSLADPNPFAKTDRRTGNVTIRLDDASQAAQLVNLQVDVEIEVKPGSFE